MPIGGIEELNKQTSTGITKVGSSSDFGEIFAQELENVKFSAHAQSRLTSKEIDLSENDMLRLNSAVDKLEQKGGNESLVRLADTMRKCFKRNADVCFRYGGEEFVVCYSVAQADDALMLAEKLRAAVEGLQIKSGKNTENPYVTVSIGVSMYRPEDDPTITDSELIQKADNELYAAKTASRNAVYYNGERVDGSRFVISE